MLASVSVSGHADGASRGLLAGENYRAGPDPGLYVSLCLLDGD